MACIVKTSGGSAVNITNGKIKQAVAINEEIPPYTFVDRDVKLTALKENYIAVTPTGRYCDIYNQIGVPNSNDIVLFYYNYTDGQNNEFKRYRVEDNSISLISSMVLGKPSNCSMIDLLQYEQYIVVVYKYVSSLNRSDYVLLLEFYNPTDTSFELAKTVKIDSSNIDPSFSSDEYITVGTRMVYMGKGLFVLCFATTYSFYVGTFKIDNGFNIQYGSFTDYTKTIGDSGYAGSITKLNDKTAVFLGKFSDSSGNRTFPYMIVVRVSEDLSYTLKSLKIDKETSESGFDTSYVKCFAVGETTVVGCYYDEGTYDKVAVSVSITDTEETVLNTITKERNSFIDWCYVSENLFIELSGETNSQYTYYNVELKLYAVQNGFMNLIKTETLSYEYGSDYYIQSMNYDNTSLLSVGRKAVLIIDQITTSKSGSSNKSLRVIADVLNGLKVAKENIFGLTLSSCSPTRAGEYAVLSSDTYINAATIESVKNQAIQEVQNELNQ